MAIGLSTYHTGFSFGTYLQAYALQEILKDYDDVVEIFSPKSLLKNRDFRLNKIIGILKSTVFDKELRTKTFSSYFKDILSISHNSITMFDAFKVDRLNTRVLSTKEMSDLARQDKYRHFVCGSDQIWDATSAYLDPVYFLRFAPQEKRVAYAPSMGDNRIAPHNKSKFSEYISEFEHLSTREKQSVGLIESLAGKPCHFVLDPTLLHTTEFWEQTAKASSLSPEGLRSSYVLTLFLSEPKSILKNAIIDIIDTLQMPPLSIRYDFGQDGVESLFMDAGPYEFLHLINQSDYVLTDSYHGVCFSLLFRKPFIIFPRNYGKDINQNSRIESLLETLELTSRYFTIENRDILESSIQYDKVENILNDARVKSFTYLGNALNGR